VTSAGAISQVLTARFFRFSDGFRTNRFLARYMYAAKLQLLRSDPFVSTSEISFIMQHSH